MTNAFDEFLASLDSPWPRDTAASVVRALQRPTIVEESIKWGNPFFSLSGRAIAKIFVAREWINVYFYRGAELSDPDNLLGPEGNSAMTKLVVRHDEAVPAGLRVLMNEAIEIAQRNTHVDPLTSARRQT